jgi:C-terminal processing protease CtpA/Prc
LKEEIFKEMLDNAEMTRYELDDIKIDFNKKLEELSEDLTGRRKNIALRKLIAGLNSCFGGKADASRGDKSLNQLARTSGLSIVEIKREVQKDMGGGIDLDDLTDEDLDKPLSILARDLTRRKRRKLRHASMMILRPNAMAKRRRREKSSKSKNHTKAGKKRSKKLVPMPSAAQVMKKLRKIISKLVKNRFLPDSNLKQLIGEVKTLDATRFRNELSREFAGIAITSETVPANFDATLQQLADSIKQQGEALCKEIPGKLRLILKHMLKRDPTPDELVGVALSSAGADPKDLLTNIAEKISRGIKLKSSEMNQTEANLGAYLVQKVRKKFLRQSRRHADRAVTKILAAIKTSPNKLKTTDRGGENKTNEITIGEDELAFTIEKGPIGMKLFQVDEENCGVQSVKDGYQASHLGFEVRDVIKYIGQHKIPADRTALEVALARIKDQPRPLRVVIYRDPLYEQKSRENHPIFDPNMPISKLDWATKTPHNELPTKVPPAQYDVRWDRASKFKSGNMKFCASVHGQGSEVKNVGRKRNVKKGIHALDHVIGVQGVDIQYEEHTEVLALINSALEDAGKRPFIMRLEHHSKKFLPLADKPDTSKDEYDVVFKEHPLDMGLVLDDQDMDDGRPSGRVADALPGSFAAKMNIEEGDEITGIEGSDVEHIDFVTLYHMLHYAETPLRVRLRRLRNFHYRSAILMKSTSKSKRRSSAKKFIWKSTKSFANAGYATPSISASRAISS